MAKLVASESLAGTFACCSLILILIIGSGVIQVALSECRDALFNKLHIFWTMELKKMENILNAIDDKDHTLIGGVSVANILEFGHTKCHLKGLTEDHFRGPQSYCEEGDLKVINIGVKKLVNHYSKLRRLSCEAEMRLTLNGLHKEAKKTKKVLVDFYDKRARYSQAHNRHDERPKGWFPSCLEFINKTQKFIPCSDSKLVKLGEDIDKWYAIRSLCLGHLPAKCSSLETPVKNKDKDQERLKGREDCRKIHDCMLEFKQDKERASNLL